MSEFDEKRNSTDFPLEIYNWFKGLKYQKDDIINYNQFLIREFFRNYTQRGLLHIGEMGSGKTRTAALILKEFPNMRLVIIAPSKVASRFDYEFEKIAMENPERITKLSLRANNLAAQVERLPTDVEDLFAKPLDNTVLVMDEAHNFFNSVTNGAGNAVQLYDLIMAAKNLKVLFLTGTPIMNRPFELAVAYNLVAGYKLFPENEEDFNTFFITPDGRHIANAEAFKRRIVGLTSYVGSLLTPEAETAARRPRVLPTQIVEVEMTERQYAQYSTFRDKEKEEAVGFKSNKGERFAAKNSSSTYRIKSRMASNLVPIDGSATVADLSKSPKFLKLLEIAESHKSQPGIICSNFVHHCGIEDIAKLFEEHGWRRWDPDTHTAKTRYPKTYAVVTGDQSNEEAERIQEVASRMDNADGSSIRVVFLGPAAAEGIEFKNFRWSVIVDPFFNDVRNDQFANRIDRLDSHIGLPPKQRTIQPYKLVATIPKEVRERRIKAIEEQKDIGRKERAMKMADIQSTDEYLYVQAFRRKILALEYKRAQIESSIECALMRDRLPAARAKKINCLMCAPTGVEIFNPRIDKDLQSKNPCRQAESTKIKAKELVVELADGTSKTYMYSETDGVFEFYERNEMVKGWVPVARNDPNYQLLLDSVTPKTKSKKVSK